MQKKYLNIHKYILAVIALFFLSPCPQSHARDEYAKKTGKGCILCHQQEIGGPLKVTGIAYIKNGYQYPIPNKILKKAELHQNSFHKILRFIIGYIHILAAFILIGAIFYIHIFIKPSQITGGLPRGERILGLSCLFTLTFTGIYLTWFRIDTFEQFFNNTFGLILFIKILLFIIMLLTALTAVTIIHGKMKKESIAENGKINSDEITLNNLDQFNGASGKPAYIVFNNKIYDVSDSPKWKQGSHFKKHKAGQDLTEAIKGAPHGPDVLEYVKFVGELLKTKESHEKISPTRRKFIFMAYGNMIFILLILLCIAVWRWGFPISKPYKNNEVAMAAESCIKCHQKLNPGIYYDWKESVHAKVGVDCYKCHQLSDSSSDLVFKAHFKHTTQPISIVVSPKICENCHAKEFAEYSRSKHANTINIMWKVDKWLQHGMNNEIERRTGCYACHGTVVTVKDGRPVSGTWPNVGVGRKNPDGSLGSCTSCHTRHKFSIQEARKPEACGQCHLGPDHPQIEIYNESKHGAIYHAEGDSWNWETEDGMWLAGRDFRSPTCSACHMSAGSTVPSSHDVTERLAWETQAPLTVRPNEFKAFPASTKWEVERSKMRLVCMQCHSESWQNDHFSNLDEVVQNYNEQYYIPAKQAIDELYHREFLSKESYFDEDLEWEFYELWHHEGRRARMGAAMMAPDYAWWHGFYELKHRFIHFMKDAEEIRLKRRSEVYHNFPGKHINSN